LTFVLIFIAVFSFLEKLIAAKAAARLVKSPNRAGYCYRVNIFFSAWSFDWRGASNSRASHREKPGSSPTKTARLFVSVGAEL
jgi:hypothetical protein